MIKTQKTGYLFPGQGAQYVGMGLDLYEKYEAAKEVFDKADHALGIDLKKICFQGPKEELIKTDISQPAILTVSIAALRVLEKKGAVQPSAAAGLSLGEYSALVAAGVMPFEDAVRVVRLRGEFMQEAANRNKGAMASVLGLSKEATQEIADAAGVQIANLNCPGQIVISGLTDDINKAAGLAKEKGASRVIILDVSGPFHSKYMTEAGVRLEKELEKVKFAKPCFPVAANVTAHYQNDPQEIKRNLVEQVSKSVLWEDLVCLLAKDGISTFFEIGPGTVLNGLLRRIDANLKVLSIGTAEEIERFTGGI